jgi:hypothetical protein
MRPTPNRSVMPGGRIGGCLLAVLVLMWSAATAENATGGAVAKRASRKHQVCPAHDRRQLRSAVPGADKALVPGDPNQVLVCRYRGLGTKPSSPRAFHLISHYLVADKQFVTRVARELNKLKPNTGVQACPLDDGSAIVAFFGYPRGPQDPVRIGLSGCLLVTNGHLHREATSQLIHQLERPGTGGSP